MLKTPFHTSEPLINKVRALLGHGNETDFGPLTNDKITFLTSSLKSAFFKLQNMILIPFIFDLFLTVLK